VDVDWSQINSAYDFNLSTATANLINLILTGTPTVIEGENFVKPVELPNNIPEITVRIAKLIYDKVA
jgi:hypothetical protein